MKEDLNNNEDFQSHMKKRDKILLATLGGATIGMLLFSWERLLNFLGRLFSFDFTVGVIAIILTSIGLVIGGYIGYVLGKRS